MLKSIILCSFILLTYSSNMSEEEITRSMKTKITCGSTARIQNDLLNTIYLWNEPVDWFTFSDSDKSQKK